MFGIPMQEAAPPEAPKSYGFIQQTTGAFSVQNPQGAIGAWIKLISIGTTTGGSGGCCAKYVAIPKGEVHTFSGSLGTTSTLTTTANPSVSMSAANGGSSGGDVNFAGQTGLNVGGGGPATLAFPVLSLGKSGVVTYDSSVPYNSQGPAGVEIIWNFGD